MSAPASIRERVEALRAAITAYRTLYHERDESPISPEALDSLKYELAQLEAQFPELVTKDPEGQPTSVKSLSKRIARHVHTRGCR